MQLESFRRWKELYRIQLWASVSVAAKHTHYTHRADSSWLVGLPDKSGFRWLNFYLSRPARRTNRNTKAATTATIPRAKRMVFIVLLLSGDSMSEYYTMGEFRRARSRLVELTGQAPLPGVSHQSNPEYKRSGALFKAARRS